MEYKFIQVSPRERLLSIDNISALGPRIKALKLPRREVAAELTNVLYAYIEAGGVILDGESQPIDIYPGIVDDAHGEDGSGCWISEQRRRGRPKRRPRQSMLLRLQLYDAAFILAGRPVLAEARERDLIAVRALLRGFTPKARARYIEGVRKLRRSYAYKRGGLMFGFAVRQLRFRIAAEVVHWKASQ